MPDSIQFASYARVLRLTPVDTDLPLAQPVPPASSQSVTATAGAWRSRRGLASLLLLVIAPTCLVIGYFWLLAADRYESEARFVLRTPNRTITDSAAVSNLMQGAGAGRTADDGYVVREFLESRDAMALLEKSVGLRQIFGAAKRDPIWGYPSLFRPDNDERLFKHYERMMSASFDSATGVSSLSIQAFSPEDAQRLEKALLDAAETLVNRLNERARRDAVAFAESEADRMRQRTLAAQAALTVFRERERLVDPSHATLAVLETIARLSTDAAELSVHINELTKGSPLAPQLTALRNRRASIEAQIKVERQRLAGDAQSIAPRIADYERLMLEREFAERALMSAMMAVEMARMEAQRQFVYLERVAEPNRPDYPAYPLRIIWTLVTLAGGYMAYRMWRILATDAQRHTDL